MVWRLDESFETSAGRVAAGRCGAGPDLVLAHGWPWSSYSWRRLIPELAAAFRVHWFDMPGYGRSSMTPGQRTSLDVQGVVFGEMLDHWALSQPLVLAHDFGGAVTLRAHLLHGRDYAGYALMNVVAMRPWGSAFFDHVGRHVAAFEGLPPHIHKAVVEAYIQSAAATGFAAEDLAALAAPWLSDDGQRSFYQQFAQADEAYTAEVEPMFGAIRSPVRILWGEADPWIPIERGRALHERVGQGAFVPLPGVGHMPQLEAPETLLTELAPFLTAPA